MTAPDRLPPAAATAACNTEDTRATMRSLAARHRAAIVGLSQDQAAPVEELIRVMERRWAPIMPRPLDDELRWTQYPPSGEQSPS